MQSTQATLPQALDLGKDCTSGEPIFDVVMSHQRFLVVVTSQCVRVITICSNYKLETIPHREWEPSGVACHENGTHLVISLGQGQGYSRESAECRITLCKYELDSLPRKLSYSSFKLPTEHRPKRISLDADGSIVTCVTTIQNKLLVWEVHEDFVASKEPFDFVKNHYAVVSTPNRTLSTQQDTSLTY